MRSKVKVDGRTTTGWHYMPSFSAEKIRMIEKEVKEEQSFKEIWNSWNFWNSRWKFEILVVLQGGTICLISLVKNSE